MTRLYLFLVFALIICSGLSVSAAVSDSTLFLPAATHTPGQNSTMWLTDVDVFNYGAADAAVTVYLLKADTDNTTPEEVDFTVTAGQTVLLSDILGSEFSYNNAGLAFETDVDTILVNSRMYNTASLCGGTFGMYIPAVGSDQAGGGNADGGRFALLVGRRARFI